MKLLIIRLIAFLIGAAFACVVIAAQQARASTPVPMNCSMWDFPQETALARTID